jgi:hypothetical protein
VEDGDVVTVDGAQALLHSVRHTLCVWLSAGGWWLMASSGGDIDDGMKVEFSSSAKMEGRGLRR